MIGWMSKRGVKFIMPTHSPRHKTFEICARLHQEWRTVRLRESNSFNLANCERCSFFSSRALLKKSLMISFFIFESWEERPVKFRLRRTLIKSLLLFFATPVFFFLIKKNVLELANCNWPLKLIYLKPANCHLWPFRTRRKGHLFEWLHLNSTVAYWQIAADRLIKLQ